MKIKSKLDLLGILMLVSIGIFLVIGCANGASGPSSSGKNTTKEVSHKETVAENKPEVIDTKGEKPVVPSEENPEIPPVDKPTTPSVEEPVNYTITFDSNGGSAISTQTIENGKSGTVPSTPVKNGFIFEGWYKDEKLTEKYDFNTPVESSILLYAKYSALGKVGDIAYSDGSVSASYDNSKVAVGIVVNAPGGIVKKILSLSYTDPAFTKWGTGKEVSIGAISETDGMANFDAIKSINNWQEKYPIFKIADEYTDASDNSDWYLPAIDELDAFYKDVETIRKGLKKVIDGGGVATDFYRDANYWSSTVTTDTFRPISYNFEENRMRNPSLTVSYEVIKTIGFYSNSERARLMRYF